MQAIHCALLILWQGLAGRDESHPYAQKAMIEVVNPGLLTTIQDAGRVGYEQYGFPHSGFFDPFLAGIANRLAGNPPDAPLLEFAMIGPTLRFHVSASIGISGYGVDYECETMAPKNQAVRISEGGVLRFVAMKGWFGYIAVSGGILTDKILGSSSTYFAGNLGTRLLKNSVLKFGESSKKKWALRENNWKYPENSVLHILSAQHTSDFADAEIQKITVSEFQIHSQSNRMGIRLEGDPIQSQIVRRSVPTLPGTIQVPGSGLPIILGPEGPTTGGYAQIGMLSRTSWTVLAGKRPGTSIRFEWIDRRRAREMWQRRQNILDSADAWQVI